MRQLFQLQMSGGYWDNLGVTEVLWPWEQPGEMKYNAGEGGLQSEIHRQKDSSALASSGSEKTEAHGGSVLDTLLST